MKFGQFIELNMRNNFCEKSYTKCGGETIPRPLSKLSIYLDQWSKALYSLFILHAKLRTVEMHWKQAADHVLLPDMKLFWKIKKRSGTSLLALFSIWYLKKKNSFVLFYYLIWVRIKCIVIAKYDVFFHYRDAKEISFYYFHNTKLCAKHEKTLVNSIYIVGIMFVR